MWWTDLRLSWDPAQYGGITELSFFAAGYALPEETDIWVPDVQPFSSVEGLSSQFDASMAVVNSEGRVWWSRPGNLHLMCRFSGLVAFPYDTFSCPLEVGGWANSGRVQGLSSADTSVTSRPGCADYDHSEESSQPSYQEVKLAPLALTDVLYLTSYS